jgi:uncharacterized membrane protein (DUF4010 family)
LTPLAVAGRLAAALAIGLLLGIDRERHKGEGPGRGAAGIRTFALTALLGGLCGVLASPVVTLVGGAFVAALAVLTRLRRSDEDPGITTETALMVAFMLGLLAQSNPPLAAGVGVVVTVLLASRTRLHDFVQHTLTEQEYHDALIFAAAAFVVLPLVPNRGLGPYGALNPFTVWLLVVIVMSVNALGYIALRLLGPDRGLELAGFISGFVSAVATIGAMGGRAKMDRTLLRPAAAAAILATVATVLQLALIVGATSPPTLAALLIPLTLAGIAAAGYGLLFMLVGHEHTAAGASGQAGRAFDLRSALILAGTVSVIMVVSAILMAQLGNAGLILSTAVAGFADTHAAAISAATLAAEGKVAPTQAALAILAGLTTNTVSKAIVTWTSGPGGFRWRVWLGLALTISAAWVGFALSLRH